MHGENVITEKLCMDLNNYLLLNEHFFKRFIYLKDRVAQREGETDNQLWIHFPVLRQPGLNQAEANSQELPLCLPPGGAEVQAAGPSFSNFPVL